MKKRIELLVLTVFLCASCAWAQKNEVGALVGGYLPIGSILDISPGIAVQGVFSHRLASVPLLSLYVELPVVVGFRLSASNTLASADYSALFIAPGLKLKVAPGFPLSPYLALGGGYARFHASNSITGSTTDNKGTVDFGGGLDIKVLPHISLRAEARDFLTSSFTLLNVAGITGHNVVAAGGIVLRF